MKKIIAVLVVVSCIAALIVYAFGKKPGAETDYAAAIMVDGEVYYKPAGAMPAEIDESAILGYTESYTDTFPEKNGETNFNRELGMPYAKVEGGIAVLFENEWYLCTLREDTL